MRRGWRLALALVAACGDHAASSSSDGGHFALTPVDASLSPADAPSGADHAGRDAPADHRAATDVRTDVAEGVDAAPDASPPAGFVTSVVRFDPGPCAGYGRPGLPGVVEGPPVGGGAMKGSTDVLSLGNGGTIVLGFAPDAIVDGDGIDFLVFENAFDYGTGQRYVEPGEVSVSEDGVTWSVFPCHDTSQAEPDGGWDATRCAGMNPVYSSPTNGISPVDVQRAGGDPFDLAWIGVKRAKFVRIRSVVVEDCPDADAPDDNGFDLDAIAIVHAGR